MGYGFYSTRSGEKVLKQFTGKSDEDAKRRDVK